MNSLRNSVQLIGRLGANPEVKTLDKNRKVAKFSLATSDIYFSKSGEKIEETQWHNIIAWNGLATICEKYLTKGKEVALEGKIMNRSYTDKEGKARYITEIVINELLMLDARKAG
ncbi:MAG: single-stranded DNA-binding protein [Lentimicrobiaceae bacterium]|jgi:single-strand DNA-binding protein|nr:single-stranded DNA-binding protein [Lentimicrobiaceae bacterium]MDD4597963.1 single-stranded DNA-binding protein [Lentimicrobiaceae bacterium]MDY0025954.1 single-stranded DNA-binding protein [Lentimicrobium sp.]